MKNKKRLLRNKADKLAKELALKWADNKCLVCNSSYGTTAHHYFYRSSCSHLRFDLDNLVVLCRGCHFLAHFRDAKLIEAKIVEKKGKKWVEELTKRALQRPKSSYLNTKYYEDVIKRLKSL